MSTPKDQKDLDQALESLEIDLINVAASLTSVLPGLTSLLSYSPGDAIGAATFTRAGARSYTDVNGIIQQAASGVLRDQHFEGTRQGTLLEDACTNLILQSNTLSNAAWTNQSITSAGPGIGTNSTTAPDGTVTASLVAFPIVSVAGSCSTVGQTPAGQTAAPQTFSLYLRGNLGTETIYLMSTNDNVTYQRTLCTLTNKWQRFSVTTGSGNNYRVSLGRDLRDGSQTGLGSTINIYAWGGQLEAGTTATSLVLTTTTSVTCPADVLTIPATPVGASFVSVSCYLNYLDKGAQARANAGGKTLFSIGNGTDRFGVSVTNTPGLTLTYRTASTDHTVADTVSPPVLGNTVEVIATVSAGGVANMQHTINGAGLTTPVTTTVTPPASWGSANIEIGSLSGVSQGGIVLFGLIFVAGVVALARARSAAHTAIAIGPDTTPAQLVLSPSVISGIVGSADVQASTVITNAAGSVIPGATTTYASSNTGIFTVTAGGLVHLVAVGSATLTATSSVPAVNDTTNVTVTVSPPTGVRSGRYQSSQTRKTYRSPARDNSTDRAWVAAHIDELENTDSNFGNAASWPTQLDVQTYTLLQRPEIDGGAVFTSDGLGGGSWSAGHDDSKASVACQAFSVNYAAANGLNDELFWLHVQTGDQNKASSISSITPAGVILFANPFAAGQTTSYPYAVGQTVTLTGLSSGNGTYTIASLQKNGVTISGWSAGQLGTAPILIQNKIGTLYIPGDGTLTFANRKVWYNFSEWRHIIYPGNVNARQMHLSRYSSLVIPNAGKPVSGCLIDEMDSSMVSPGIIQSVEYGNTGGAAFGSSTVCQYSKDIAQCMQDIRAGIPGLVFHANTAAFSFSNDFAVAVGAGGIQGEQLLNIFGSDTAKHDFFISLVNASVTVEYVDGNTWLQAANNGGVTPNPGVFTTSGSYTAGNYPSASDRRQMASYALYLMGVDVKHTKADGTWFHYAEFDLTNSVNPGDIPSSSHHTAAMEVDIGQPIQPYVKNAVQTPPTGSNVRVFSRNFSKDGGATLSAIALLSYSSGSPASTNYDDTSLVSFTLPTPPAGMGWFRLNRDGTLAVGGTGATTVSLRRAEGLVMVAATTGIHVATAGSDTTGDGTTGNPYKTLAKGMAVAVSGQSVLGNGGDTFRETVTYTGTNITFSSYGTGQAIVSGADPVTPWTASGVGPNTYTSPVSNQPLMVFSGATRLTKGGSQSTLLDQQWFWASSVLYVRNNAGSPSGIEASNRVYAFNSNSHTGMKVVNMTIQRTQHSSNGAIFFDGVGTLDGIAATDNLIQDNYTTGIYIHQDSNGGDFSRNTIINNGQHGIWVAANPTTGSTNQTMNDNLVDHNGWRVDPNINFCSGIIGSVRSGEVARNVCSFNGFGGSGGHAHGIYLSSDLASGLVLLVHDNICHDQFNGFGLKLTQSATVWNNKFYNNTGGGANLGPNAGTNDVVVLFYRNLIYGNATLGGAGIDISRSAGTGNLSVRGYHNTTYNNSSSNSAGEVNVESSLLVWDWRNNLHIAGTASNAKYIQSATQTGGTVTIDNNAYFGSANSTPFRYNNTGMTLATWRAQTFAASIDAHAVVTDPKVVSLVTPDLTLLAGSPCIDAGVSISGINDGTSGSVHWLGVAPDIGYTEKS